MRRRITGQLHHAVAPLCPCSGSCEVYGQPWWKVATKEVLLLGAYVLLIALALSGLVVAAVYMVGE